MYIYIYAYTYMCVCVYLNSYSNICLYICIEIDINTRQSHSAPTLPPFLLFECFISYHSHHKS